MNMNILAIFGLPGGAEWIVILIVALLVFGRRLPDVARSVGKSIVEFKKGLKDVKNEIDVESSIEQPEKLEHKKESTVPRTGQTSGPVFLGDRAKEEARNPRTGQSSPPASSTTQHQEQ